MPGPRFGVWGIYVASRRSVPGVAAWTAVDEAALYRLLDDLLTGSVSPDDVVRRIRRLPYGDLGFARVDHHRALRQGLPEAVYGPGKTVDHCVAIVGELLGEADGGPVVLSRATDEQAAATLAAHPGGERHGPTIFWRRAPLRHETVAVFAAGTADLPVAEECTATLMALGFEPAMVADCGVAGVHRVLEHVDLLASAHAVVVVAGMEGALASLVGGLTPAPVTAVPTSAGYGASLQGVTALLAMLSSCVPGISVVGIDNGFGAAWAVARILARPASGRSDGGTHGQGAAQASTVTA
jgi:NCAIR mutase (PurE)-related protein